jgi:hypothetical protein
MKLFFKASQSEKKPLLDDDALTVALVDLKNDTENDSKKPPEYLPIEYLADELWLKICCLLDVKSLCQLSQANRRHNRIIQDPAVWNTLFWRDFPGVMTHGLDAKKSYRLFCQGSRDEESIGRFPSAIQALLSMRECHRGSDLDQLVKPKGLTIQTLLTKVGKRPLIQIFSRNQPLLNTIYGWLKLNLLDRTLAPTHELLLRVLCNQYRGFENAFQRTLKKMPLDNVEKLMFYAVILGYENIIHGLYKVRPDIDLQKEHWGKSYLDLTIRECNQAAGEMLLALDEGLPIITFRNS